MLVIGLLFSFTACDENNNGTTSSESPSASEQTSVTPDESVNPSQTQTASNIYYCDGDSNKLIFDQAGNYELKIEGNRGTLTSLFVEQEGNLTVTMKFIITGSIRINGNIVEMDTDMGCVGVTHYGVVNAEDDGGDAFDQLMDQLKNNLKNMGLADNQIEDVCSGEQIALTADMGKFANTFIRQFPYKSFKANLTDNDSFVFIQAMASEFDPLRRHIYDVKYYPSGAVEEITTINHQLDHIKDVETYYENGNKKSWLSYVVDDVDGWRLVGETYFDENGEPIE